MTTTPEGRDTLTPVGTSPPRYVYLWSIDNPVILVPARTGVIYCNQVDGVACVQAQLEGFLLPLSTIQAEVFNPEWWHRNCGTSAARFPEVWTLACEQIEAALNAREDAWDSAHDVRVIRDSPENCEAWVHVSFLMPTLGPDGDGKGTERLEGVLTWENCD